MIHADTPPPQMMPQMAPQMTPPPHTTPHIMPPPSPQIHDDDWWKYESVMPFKPCSSFVVSGATKSGKTWWVYRLLRERVGMFVPNPPSSILYCYSVYQPLFDDMKMTFGDDIRFVEGLPSSEDVDNLTSDGRHHVIILDDVMQKVVQSPEMALLFTQGCHHKNLSVIFITQNLFAQGKSSRNIALNTTYVVLLKNVRDASQATLLGRQLYPGKTDGFMRAYTEIMMELRGYLIIDLAPDTPDEMRLRTRVFIGEDPIVYAP